MVRLTDDPVHGLIYGRRLLREDLEGVVIPLTFGRARLITVDPASAWDIFDGW